MSASFGSSSCRRGRVLWVLTASLCFIATIVWLRDVLKNQEVGERKLYGKLGTLELFGLTPKGFIPTMAPTVTPTISASPSRRPTIKPSFAPSSQPSSNPSKSFSPSGNPTIRPSSFPMDNPSNSPSGVPTLRTSDSPSSRPSAPPTANPSSSPSSSPTAQPSVSPTNKPSASPSSSPTAQPSSSPSSLPSQSPTDFLAETVFYAIADTPYNFQQKREMPALIASIPDDAAFVIHLGDIKSSATPCDYTNFAIADGFLSQSKVPAFFVIGDNEWNDCQYPDAAFALWKTIYVRFDRKYWKHDLQVKQMPGRPESFTFVNRGTLFIGLNLVGSPVVDWTEWNNRTRTQLDWTLELIEQGRSGDMAIGAIVIFAHANLDGKHRLFVDPLVAYVRDVLQDRIPIMYIGGDNHSWLYEPGYKGLSSFLRARKTGGTNEPPLRIVVNPAAGLLESDYGVKASTERAFQLTRFPTSDIATFNGRSDFNGTVGGLASEDLDDDVFIS